MESIWMKDYQDKNLKNINKNIETPVLIIGGGIAGLMCAYNLMRNKIKFVLVEGKKLGGGVSAYTTAQVSVAHDNLYEEIKNKHGETIALEYYKSQIEGLEIIKNIIKSEKIACDYQEESTILYANEKKNIETLNIQYDLLKKYNKVKLIKKKKESLNFELGLEFPNQFIFNPIKYMMKIIDILINNGTQIYENSLATQINKKDKSYEVIINNKYKIYTDKIIMACHYPFLNPDNLYFTKIYQSKSYAISFKTKLKLKANYVSLDAPYFYFRSYDEDTLIIGGCDHFTGIDTDIKACYNKLINKIHELDPMAQIEKKWFTEDCMSIDSLPFVGYYSNKNPDIILVTGFQKWGFTNSHIAAKNVINLLNSKNYTDLYKTNRWVLFKNFKNTLRMGLHSLNGLIISKLFIQEHNLNKIKIDSGIVTRYKNINVLVYRESKNKYLFLKNQCTHMGCSLIWNDTDKVWESKCHGSIFDKTGKVIYGPAIQDLEKIKF